MRIKDSSVENVECEWNEEVYTINEPEVLQAEKYVCDYEAGLGWRIEDGDRR